MLNLLQKLIKKTFNIFDLDIVRASKNPKHTLINLRHLPIRTIIDVGANEGQFAKMIINVFPEAHIFCFEPLSTPFEELSKWAEKKNKQIKIFNIALGDREGSAEMLVHSEHSPSSSLLKSTKLCETLYPLTKKQISMPVQLTTLDKITSNCSDPLVPDILIKLDVQGYEAHVIRGGKETFRKARACIVEVCLDTLYENQANFKDIVFLLHEFGLHYTGNINQVYAHDGHVIYCDAAFLRNH